VKGWLLDENIPRNVTFTPALPVSHARDLGPSVSDTLIWSHAREHALAIVSKDADFSHRIMLGAPPAMGGAFAVWESPAKGIPRIALAPLAADRGATAGT
jgi:hypothetical protein